MTHVETVTLYRPVAIFYPVLDEEYAVPIARDWNTKDAASGFVGYVTRFQVRADFLSRYSVQTAGSARKHREYWVPADELAEFNAARAQRTRGLRATAKQCLFQRERAILRCPLKDLAGL